jgi:hypothetical protein
VVSKESGRAATLSPPPAPPSFLLHTQATQPHTHQHHSEGYAWAEDKEHCEEYGRMLNADPSKVSARAKKRGLPQMGTLGAGNHCESLRGAGRVCCGLLLLFGCCRCGWQAARVCRPPRCAV